MGGIFSPISRDVFAAGACRPAAMKREALDRLTWPAFRLALTASAPMDIILAYSYVLMSSGRHLNQGIGTKVAAVIARNHTQPQNAAGQRSLVREIALVLCIKLLLLVGLRVAWFNDPPADKMESTTVAEVIFSSPSRTEGELSPLHRTQRDQP